MHDRIEPVSGQEKLRILLLEDSDIDAELIETHLSSSTLFFTIFRARSRSDYQKLLEHSYDIILADYSLPDIDGLAALTIARERQPQIPFVFVSGVVGEEFATNALQQGAVDYVTKRNLRRLRTAVSRAVAEARERQRRLRIEADLRASEAGSRLALKAARLGGWDYDVVANVLRWDERCRDICGVGPDDDVTGQMFRSLIHPDDHDRIIAQLDCVMHSPDGEMSEQFRLLTPNGRLVWIESTGSSIFDDGVCVRFVGVIRDITAEKQSELALLDRTATLQASLEQQVLERHLLWRNSQDLLAVIGPDGRVRDMTPSWQRLLGTALDAVIGRTLKSFVHPDDLARTETFLAPGPLGPRALEARLRHRDGSYRWFSWTALPDVDGVFYANARNIQEEKDAAERVRTVEETLRQAHKMEAVGQLTGGIAHDFNNMLAGVIGSLDAIRRRLAKQRYDDIDRFMDAAATSAQRAAALTQRLLAFSRRQTLDVKSEDADDIVQGMTDLLHRTLGENIQLQTHTQPGLWRCETDANQLESAILNLTINARDAMPQGGRLVIELANVEQTRQSEAIKGLELGEYVSVSVADTGQGMAPETLAKAFDPFFTTKPIGQGTGLGLSMVYGFVNQVGGNVQIISKIGEGTRIILYFKRSQAEPSNVELRLSTPEVRADGSTVLVVEDDPSVRMLISEALKDLGCECLQAGDADAALPFIASAQKLDLIVSDVGLPGMNGRELASLARQTRPQIPILFVTGYADGVDKRSDMLGPGMDMLAKPFSNEQLAERVGNLLSH